MNMLKSFRNYLMTQVSYLDDIIVTWDAVRRKRRLKASPLKKKERGLTGGKPERSPDSILGVSRTVVKPSVTVLGKSKTTLSGLSDFIVSDIPKPGSEAPTDKYITLDTEGDGEVDLVAEEIPLEYTAANSMRSEPAATGISIEEIERMNRFADNPGLCTPGMRENVQKTVEKLLGTDIFRNHSTAFSTRLGELLDECQREDSGDITGNDETD